MRKGGLCFRYSWTEDGTWDLSRRYRDREAKETRLLTAKMMPFPQTTPDDDAPERSGSFVSGDNQETKNFYVKRGSSCGRGIPEKPQKERVSTMFKSPLIMGLQSTVSLVMEMFSLSQEEVGPKKQGISLLWNKEKPLFIPLIPDSSIAGVVPSRVARRRSGVAGKEKIREQPSRDQPSLEGSVKPRA
ncbi:hypothetical protein ACLOJK_020882 [Asimina triloba]